MKSCTCSSWFPVLLVRLHSSFGVLNGMNLVLESFIANPTLSAAVSSLSRSSFAPSMVSVDGDKGNIISKFDIC